MACWGPCMLCLPPAALPAPSDVHMPACPDWPSHQQLALEMKDEAIEALRGYEARTRCACRWRGWVAGCGGHAMAGGSCL